MRDSPLTISNPLRTAMLRLLQAAGIVCAAVWLARAAPEERASIPLSYAGTLRTEDGEPVAGRVALRFQFVRAGTIVCSALVDVDLDSGGAFDAQIPTDGCPENLFDGTDVTFNVFANGVEVGRGESIGAAPHAKYADAVGTPVCPPGYARADAEGDQVVCKRGPDEVVRVGAGTTAFWIDRYEASAESEPDGSGTRFGVNNFDDFPPVTFPDDGQYEVPVFAISRSGVWPSVYANWLQARAACEASGKRLPTVDEWLEAARGTPDPASPSDGIGGACVTQERAARRTGGGATCRSAWGVQDMIGNFWEWTADWLVGLGDGTATFQTWPFNDDATWNVVSSSATRPAPEFLYQLGLPSALRHGGATSYGTAAGVFYFDAAISPAMAWALSGIRCVLPR